MAEERLVTLAEVKEMLDKASSERAELTYEQKQAKEHVVNVCKLDVPTTKKMIKDLEKINKVTPQIAVKITEILPTHPDDIRALYAKERFALEQKDIDEILEVVRKYI
jgi:DNA-directed RNA polymerase subunit F